MKKIFLFLVLMTLVSCGNNSSEIKKSEIEPPTKISTTKNTSTDKKEVKPKKEEKITTDNIPIILEDSIVVFEDPTMEEYDDKIVINFQTEQLEKGSIARKMEFEKVEEGYTQNIILEFDQVEENYELIETIPKSFAKSVSELEFSIEPEIIEDDPVVKWFIEKQIERIQVNAKDKILGATAMAGLKAWMNGTNKEEAVVNAAGDESIMLLLESVDDIALINHINKCDKEKNDYYKKSCIFQLVSKYPSKFTQKDCEELDGSGIGQNAWMNTCKAMVNKNYKDCLKMDEYNSEDKNAYINMCLKYYYDFENKQCKNNEQCIYNTCIKGYYEKCCDYVKTPLLNNKCMAITSVNPKYCVAIEDKQEAKKCCDNMGINKDDCLEKLESSEEQDKNEENENTNNVDSKDIDENETTDELEIIEKEIADQDDFSARSSHCPYPVPDEAVWTEEPNRYGSKIQYGWKVDGKWVGNMIMYQSSKKEIFFQQACYKNGEFHGPWMQYNKEGVKCEERNYEDGELHGTHYTYHCNSGGGVKIQIDYIKGIRNGKHLEFYPDGAKKTIGTYKDGNHIGELDHFNNDGSYSLRMKYDANGKQTFYKKY